jgi:hypothetical protein
LGNKVEIGVLVHSGVGEGVEYVKSGWAPLGLVRGHVKVVHELANEVSRVLEWGQHLWEPDLVEALFLELRPAT